MDTAAIISFIGIVLGLIIFIILCFRGFSVSVSSMAAALVIIVCSGKPIMALVNNEWSSGVAGFFRGYFLIFVLSSLFGKVMSDGGAAKKIALNLYKLIKTRKGNEKFYAVLFVPTLYIMFSYVGVSPFVIVFTVLNIGAQLYKRFDVPWRLYCYGGASSALTFFLSGSLQITNIAAARASGTDMSSGTLFSVICGIVFVVIMCILIQLDVNKATRTGEGFMDSGAAFAASDKSLSDGLDEDESKLPNLFFAILPMVAVIGTASISYIKLDLVAALALGNALCFIFYWTKLKSPKTTLGEGVASSFLPVMNVACCFAIATMVRVVPGFTVIRAGLDVLPPLYQAIALMCLLAFATSSASIGIASFGTEAFVAFTAAGVSAPIAHRLMCICSAFTGIPPTSAGIANATAVGKIEYRKGVWVYIWMGLYAGGGTLLAAILLVELGIFR